MYTQLKLLLVSLSISCLMLISVRTQAQEIIAVSGKVQDSKDGTPLPGVTIKPEKGTGGTTTNDNGNFSISVPRGSKLVFSLVGYTAKTVNATGTSITVQLDNAQNDLEEVVVVGYTTQKKELLTGSVAQMKVTQSDTEIPTTSVGNLLAGRLAGVSVSTANGLPGSQPNIRIRTSSSWNPVSVLYVIDGKISSQGDFNNLSPNEVDNVTVLKDAATTAAYGSRAAGGVVLVNTKRGTSGKATISYSVNSGKDVRGKNMDLTSALEWGSIHAGIWGMGVGGPAGSPWTQTAYDYFANNDFGGGKGYGFDLLKDVYRDPFTTTHNLSASGGSDKVKYFIGASYVKQQTFIKNTDLKKYNVRANITADLNKDFSVFAGLSLNDNLTYAPTGDLGGDTYPKLLLWQPYMPSYTRSGLPVDYFWISNKSGEADGLAGYSNGETIKPTVNLSATYKVPFVTGLSAKASFIKSFSNFQNKQFTKPFTYYQLKQIEPIIWDLDNIVGSRLTAHTPRLEQFASWSKEEQLNFQLSYDRSFGKHRVNGTLVYEGYETREAGVDAAINGFPLYTTDQWWAATGGSGLVNGSPTKSVSNSYGIDRTVGRRSWIGQFSYDYAGKYIANVAYRYDGSMNFAPDKRWGFFPSASVGWILSKEKFLSNAKWIDMLKIRASVGRTGNDVYDENGDGVIDQNDRVAYRWQDSYRSGASAFYGDTPGLYPGIQYSGLSNPFYTWEKHLNKNIGVDFTFLKNFNATFEYWSDYTTDILGGRIQTTPPTFSLSLPPVNYGKVKGQGIDFSLGYNNKFGQVNFNAGIVASYGYARYIERDVNITYDYQNILGEGRATSMVVGYEVDHMIRTQGDLDAWNAANPNYKFNGRAVQLGQFVYKDLGSKNGMGVPDGVIDDNDIAVLKKRNNPVVMGLNLGVEWKGISINANFNGAFNYVKSFNDLGQGVEWNRMWQAWYDQAWTPQTPDAWLPKRFSANDDARTVNLSGSNFWLADASFLRLKNLNVGYVIPQKLYKKYVSSIKIYGSGSNLFIISKFNRKYYDPEMNSGTAFPIVKSYNFGCTVTF
ncbi:SusC/RagA family TonB-linked outer membrane protein [Pedobacter ghigonis]|uniref:SusC/RagA family TonB-linked outer membrane protein n=1 Tax=Pedobacter ghigonis TaxID=2730403 RepID=UPI00158D155C|nr:SusC/RagA family TonB-linked outer membrane protein [Pedobacter ghigonis]